MVTSQYKDISVHGFTYHYFCHASTARKPTFLFLHGFPSTSEHWTHQITHFSGKGYGIIAPDMLGYGGTSKPEDPKAYAASDLATHMVAILDAESVEKAVVVSHDWGSRVASRLANLYPERQLASVFIATSYIPPDPDFSAEDVIETVKKSFGRDIVSYWKFFASNEAVQLLENHEVSFHSILFTSDPAQWKSHVSPEGALKAWLLEDKVATIAPWAPDRERYCEVFRKGGWVAPLTWYKTLTLGLATEDDKVVPKERYKLTQPVLQVTALQDPISLPSIAKSTTSLWCTNVSIRELDTGHWVMLEKPDELNALIEEFLQYL